MPDKKSSCKGSLCKLRKKLLDEDQEVYMALVNEPNYLCTKCGRVANSKKNLCKPVKLQF